jgi:hypothetical protein
MVLASGDNPAGFDGVRRHSTLRCLRRWLSVLIAVMAEASGMVIMCEDPTDVGPITDATIEWIDRLTS